MKIPVAEQVTFLAVVSHYGWDAGEIELAREAYRRDPQAGRDLYRSLHDEITQPWRFDMSKGITERIQQFLDMTMLGTGTVTGPGQPDKPLRPPPPADPREPPPPARQDPPKEAA